jgi:DNA-3-methyladenine glycosylase I
MRSATTTTKLCSWVSVDDPLMLQYHDREWGVPVHDDRKHFEFLVLEAAQAGLSWTIVLKKREGYRRAFDGFEPEATSAAFLFCDLVRSCQRYSCEWRVSCFVI